MLLENDGNFSEVINGTYICPDSMHLSLYDVPLRAPSRAGFCSGNCSSLSLPVQTCIMLWQNSSHLFIMQFPGVITINKSDVHAKVQSQRSKMKFTEVKTQFNHFWTVTQVRIYIWWRNDIQNLMWHWRNALLFSRSYLKFQGHAAQKNHQFWPKLGVSRL